ncbi:MAG: acyl CoA:acetate/3-ketoacid CoA transferase [Lachnospiraceae bacterium]|nr:acyl CoA:acetate/3-ketoacid CoA transferase [Lachnospiraceae bacterium]
MARFVSAKEAAALIPDHAHVGVAGMGLSGWPEEIGCAVRDHYKETGHPCDLFLHQGSAMGDHGYGNSFIGWEKCRRGTEDPKPSGVRGTSRLGEAGEGLITRWNGAHVMSADALNELAAQGKITGNCLPQGVAVNLWREIAAGRPGLMTRVGLGTFIDPRVEGGRMNRETKEDVAELVSAGGEEYLFYRSFPVDVALLRGTVADENGNISFMNEGIMNEGLAVAQAAHNCGGIVIVQVQYLAKAQTLNPKEVKIPGILVDYVVVAQDPINHWQTEGVYFDPSFSGQIKRPVSSIPPMPLDERKVIARRCAMEVARGDVLNLGVGISSGVGNILAEEGCLDMVTMCSESGMIGGVPCPLPNFGSSYNPECIMEHNAAFDLIDGGGLDMTCLGLGECDKEGNINVSKFGSRLIGPGGFIDITSATPKVVFCGTFMGRQKTRIENGKLEILQEGSVCKFVDKVQQITFAGKYARKDQRILYVTERCVMELIDGIMTITEIAPGMRLQEDILDHMEFCPAVAADLKEMDDGIFREHWGGLKTILE